MQKHFSAQNVRFVVCVLQWLHAFIKVKCCRQMVKLCRLEFSRAISLTPLQTRCDIQAHILIQHMHKCVRPRRAQSQNSMLRSKRKMARAQAGNAWGPSAARWGRGTLTKSTFLIQTFCWKQRAVRRRICAITQGSHFQSNYHIMSEQTAWNTCQLNMALIVLR